MTTELNAAADIGQPDLLTMDEVAERLKIHRSTVRRLILDGELKHFRVGKFYRIATGELSRYLESCRG